MSVAFEEIRSALMKNLEMYQNTDVAWPNMEYVPVKGTGYLEPSFFPGEATQGSLGTNGVNKQVGAFQVLVWMPVGTGLGVVTVKADEIVTAFKRGTELDKNSTKVIIKSASAGGMIQHGDWVHIPVTVLWYSYTAN